MILQVQPVDLVEAPQVQALGWSGFASEWGFRGLGFGICLGLVVQGFRVLGFRV